LNSTSFDERRVVMDTEHAGSIRGGWPWRALLDGLRGLLPRRLALPACSALIAALLCLGAPANAGAGGSKPEAPIAEGCELQLEPEVIRLCGTLNPKSSAKVGYYFAYSTGSSCLGAETTAEAETEGEAIPVSARLTGLLPNTRYTYCLVAKNQYGETPGAELLFVTPPNEGRPEAPITEACGGPVGSRAVRMCGTLNPDWSAQVGFYFAYNMGTSCTEGSRTAEEKAEGQGVKVSAEAVGLVPDMQYTFCLVATDKHGEHAGSGLTFTTAGASPAIDGESAGTITQSTATLQAQINPNNEPTNYFFQYSASESLAGATIVAGGSIPASVGDRPVSVPVSGALAPGTTYYYRVLAANATGTSEGTVSSFTTAASTPVLLITGTGSAGVVGQGAATTPIVSVKPKPLTNAQKLARALRLCQKEPRRQRVSCERQARRRYGAKPKKHEQSRKSRTK
jgi:hypothetical protein